MTNFGSWLRFATLRFFAAGALALLMAMAPVPPARAGILDCVNAAFPVEEGLKAGELAAELSMCATSVSNNPVEAMVVMTIVALAANGTIPSNTDGCNSAIASLILGDVGQALVDAGVITSIDDLASIVGLDQFLACGCIVVGTPGEIDHLLDQYMAHVGGCADFFKDLGQELLNVLEDLGCFLSGGLFVGCGDDVKQACDAFLLPLTVEQIYSNCRKYGATDDAPCAETCNDLGQGDRRCQDLVCDAGTQCTGPRHDACQICGVFDPHAIASPNRDFANCTCADPYKGLYTNLNGVNVLQQCVCESPSTLKGAGLAQSCDCPLNQTLRNGVCTPCSASERFQYNPNGPNQCIPCPLGEKANKTHDKCVPACDGSKGEYLDVTCKQCSANQRVVYGADGKGPKGGLGHCEPCPSGERANSKDRTACGVPACTAGQVTLHGFTNLITGTKTADSCFSCPKDTHAVHPDQNSSNGTCVPCPPGTSALPGSAECAPLNCGVSGYQDPDNPNACKSCPATQIYIESAILPSPTATDIDKKVVKVAGHCGCGENQRLEGDVCVCAANSLKVSNPAIGGSVSACICPQGAHLDQATFACVCAAGAKLDPTGITCQCPTGQHVEGDKCVPWDIRQQPGGPAKIITPGLQPGRPIARRKDCAAVGPRYINSPRNPAVCIRCERGTVPNAARTACVSVERIVPPARELPGMRRMAPPPRFVPGRPFRRPGVFTPR